MDPDLVREFADICARSGVRFFSMYGQVEATSRMSFLDPSKISKKAGSIGKAIPGGKLWLQDENGTILKSLQEAGELVFEGPNVCMGYATGREDLSKPDLNCGVLATGDIAKMDEDGDFYIVGRKSRFLKLFGRRVNLHEVEIFLQKEGYVSVCAGDSSQQGGDVCVAGGVGSIGGSVSVTSGVGSSSSSTRPPARKCISSGLCGAQRLRALLA